jgi:hypothetical protein
MFFNGVYFSINCYAIFFNLQKSHFFNFLHLKGFWEIAWKYRKMPFLNSRLFFKSKSTWRIVVNFKNHSSLLYTFTQSGVSDALACWQPERHPHLCRCITISGGLDTCTCSVHPERADLQCMHIVLSCYMYCPICRVLGPKRLNTLRAGPTRLLPGLAGADWIFQWIGMVEYIPC